MAETATMTRADLLAAEDADVRAWFKDHRAEYSTGDVGGVRVERLIWRKPGTNCYRVDYICVDGTRLFVAGDIGEATYLAGAKELAWWARCDLSYFAGKCFASEHGRGYKCWDSERCRLAFREQVADRAPDEIDANDEDHVQNGLDAIDGGEGAWTAWMREDAHLVFGDDWWDFVPNFGIAPDMRCRGHLVGLKLALAQLAEPAHV